MRYKRWNFNFVTFTVGTFSTGISLLLCFRVFVCWTKVIFCYLNTSITILSCFLGWSEIQPHLCVCHIKFPLHLSWFHSSLTVCVVRERWWTLITNTQRMSVCVPLHFHRCHIITCLACKHSPSMSTEIVTLWMCVRAGQILWEFVRWILKSWGTQFGLSFVLEYVLWDRTTNSLHIDKQCRSLSEHRRSLCSLLIAGCVTAVTLFGILTFIRAWPTALPWKCLPNPQNNHHTLLQK